MELADLDCQHLDDPIGRQCLPLLRTVHGHCSKCLICINLFNPQNNR